MAGLIGILAAAVTVHLAAGLFTELLHYPPPHDNRKRSHLKEFVRQAGSNRVDYSECTTPAFERYDCGYYGIGAEECNSRDCCWRESNIPQVPWCYHSSSHTIDTCLMDIGDKDDCGFYGINSEECEAEGCCWMPTDFPGVPWCYHPTAPTFGGDCGVPAVDPAVRVRIVGGVEAVPHSWPWQASLQRGGSHFCGGSLIAPRWVVSAAHCAPGLYAESSIGLGKHGQEDANALVVGVEEFFIYENYDSNIYDGDIMLIKLDQEVSYTSDISPVCLPRLGQEMPVGTVCYTTGWGTTQSGGNLAQSLMQVMVPILDRDRCNSPEWYDGQITPNMICAGYDEGGRDSCQGDSGGPLACIADGRWVLDGIVSWGEGCARAQRPGLYTTVANFIDWIERTMSENS